MHKNNNFLIGRFIKNRMVLKIDPEHLQKKLKFSKKATVSIEIFLITFDKKIVKPGIGRRKMVQILGKWTILSIIT